MAFVTMSNVDAWGLWVREEKVGKDPPQAACALTNEYNEVLLYKLLSQALRDWQLPLPVSWNTHSWNPANCCEEIQAAHGKVYMERNQRPCPTALAKLPVNSSTNLLAMNEPFTEVDPLAPDEPLCEAEMRFPISSDSLNSWAQNCEQNKPGVLNH